MTSCRQQQVLLCSSLVIIIWSSQKRVSLPLNESCSAFLEKQTLELQQRGCNMMDIRGSHMLLSRNFTSAQNCGELIHYLVVLCFTLHDLTRLLCVKRWLYRNQSKNCQKIRQFEGISKICRNQSKIIRILKTVINTSNWRDISKLFL